MQQSDYVSAAVSAINSILHISPRNQATAAYVANQVRIRIPAANWSIFGYRTFKDFALELGPIGGFELGLNEKQALVVRLISARSTSPRKPQASPSPRQYNRLQEQVWLAFVTEKSSGCNFLNKVNGTVLMDVEKAPPPVDEWVEIDPIDTQTQKQWARDFLVEQQVGNKLLETSIDSRDWYSAFPEELTKTSRRLGQIWNKHRSEKVSAIVYDWCKENGVITDLAFTRRTFDRKDRHKELVAALPSAAEFKHLDGQTSKPDFQRRLVVTALQAMSTEELLQIPIPAKYMVSAMRDLEKVWN